MVFKAMLRGICSFPVDGDGGKEVGYMSGIMLFIPDQAHQETSPIFFHPSG